MSDDLLSTALSEAGLNDLLGPEAESQHNDHRKGRMVSGSIPAQSAAPRSTPVAPRANGNMVTPSTNGARRHVTPLRTTSTDRNSIRKPPVAPTTAVRYASVTTSTSAPVKLLVVVGPGQKANRGNFHSGMTRTIVRRTPIASSIVRRSSPLTATSATTKPVINSSGHSNLVRAIQTPHSVASLPRRGSVSLRSTGSGLPLEHRYGRSSPIAINGYGVVRARGSPNPLVGQRRGDTLRRGCFAIRNSPNSPIVSQSPTGSHSIRPAAARAASTALNRTPRPLLPGHPVNRPDISPRPSPSPRPVRLPVPRVPNASLPAPPPLPPPVRPAKVLEKPSKEQSVVRSGTPSSRSSDAEIRPPPSPAPLDGKEVDPEVDEEENLGYAETYADYRPSKLRSGLPHPDCVVETSSLSSVQPPEVRYHISIPEEVIDTGKLSALQLEALIYACQQHDCQLPNGDRCGYLIGDGAGVGKGRTIAGIIYENYLLGRKRALWFSVSADLKYDAERDLKDIGASRIKVHALNKFKYSKISGKENGSMKKGVIFATYSSLIGESSSAKGKYRSRLKQLLHWCDKDFDGVIVFDECHRAKNLVPTGGQKPTKTGQAVLELQKALPRSRVVYASATGATEPRNMAYMTRLGLWGEGKPFREFNDFINAVERRGVGAMEIVAMDMKQRGMYLARQLSFAGVSFRVDEVPLSKEFVQVYDESVKLWLEAKKQFHLAANLIDADRSQRKAMWGQFWASHQRFFKYLCIASKVRTCVKLAREAVKNGKCVVIGLQSTGEARTLEQLEDSGGELNDFVSTAKGVLQSLIEKHFPSVDSERALERAGFSSEFFQEFDTLPSDSSQRKRKNLSPLPQKNKKLKFTLGSHDNDSESESEDPESEDESSSEEEQNDWFETLFKEAESSDEGEEDKDLEEEPTEEDDFNPFAADFGEDDPWAAKQQVVHEEQLEVQEVVEQPPAETEEKRKKKKKKRKDPAKLAERKKRELTQPGFTAEDFLASSRELVEPTFTPGQMATEMNLNRAQMIKAELLAGVERLGENLPPNTLDQLIAELGGPENVAEMTGRKGRIVSREDGEIQYELRHIHDVPLELLNIAEKDRFMAGEKKIAIISEAASSGISLQSDRRAGNQARRVHITLELPWSADKAIQQFGRTHRSNQVSAPEYVFLISELAGEKRFASVVAKRLECLGALTHGDRRATESRDLSQFNLDTKYGRKSVEEVLKAILGVGKPRLPPPPSYTVANFFLDMRQYLEGVGVFSKEANGLLSVEKEAGSLSKFLNRILGLPVHAQNALFQYFADCLEDIVQEARKDGRFDMGILDLGLGGDNVHKTETRVFMGRLEAGNYRTELHKISVERGLSWNDALDIYSDHRGDDDGFYVTINAHFGRRTAALVCAMGKKRLETGDRLFNVWRPNTGVSQRLETIVEIKKRFRRVLPDEAEPLWELQFRGSAAHCQHTFYYGRCRNELAGLPCEIGRRSRHYYVLAGSVLSVWPVVEAVLQAVPGRRQNRMQVIRVRTSTGQKIVGVLIPNHCIKLLIEKLEEHTGRSYVESDKKFKSF